MGKGWEDKRGKTVLFVPELLWDVVTSCNTYPEGTAGLWGNYPNSSAVSAPAPHPRYDKSQQGSVGVTLHKLRISSSKTVF